MFEAESGEWCLSKGLALFCHGPREPWLLGYLPQKSTLRLHDWAIQLLARFIAPLDIESLFQLCQNIRCSIIRNKFSVEFFLMHCSAPKVYISQSFRYISEANDCFSQTPSVTFSDHLLSKWSSRLPLRSLLFHCLLQLSLPQSQSAAMPWQSVYFNSQKNIIKSIVLNFNTEKRDCLVNAAESDVWHEGGLQRRRTRFSSWNTPTDRYCDLYKKCIFHHAQGAICANKLQGMSLNGGSNPQCWNDSKEGWLIDASYVLGVLGDAQYSGTVSNARAEWQRETGCRTG